LGFHLIVVPVQEKQGERHDQQEEQRPHAKASIPLGGLADLLVGILDIFCGAHDGTDNPVDIVLLHGDLKMGILRGLKTIKTRFHMEVVAN